MTFSTNQVRHLYWCDASTYLVTPYVLPDGKHISFKYTSASGDTVSGDVIPIEGTTMYGYAAADMRKYLHKAEVTVTEAVKGKIYGLKIIAHRINGVSDSAENEYTIYVDAVATNTTPATLAAALKASLDKILAKDKILGPHLSVSLASAKITITEQDDNSWRRGVRAIQSLDFEVALIPQDRDFPVTESSGTVTYDWGTVAKSLSSSYYKNSRDLADLEYFCLGERGDIYRETQFPNDINIQYLVNPDPSAEYDVLEIHYAYQGSCEDIQKSEKHITFVGAAATLATLCAAFVTAGLTDGNGYTD